ncbi:hypothetical protein ACHAW5_001568 [Stephanodiscus triporus]|uniref:RING-type domain-containing protein n=1 Tax=Stephanodiscus triporus TaxID=2934178 RepID=A0ABD3NI42_9STRA
MSSLSPPSSCNGLRPSNNAVSSSSAATANLVNKTTTDCPICLCPITSEPWGVVNPCGHPYHRECWSQVVANHASAGGRGRNAKNAQCAICKGATRGFVSVFVDLGDDHDGDYGGGGIGLAKRNGGEGGDDCDVLLNIDGDDEDEDDDSSFEKLANESEGLWKDLEKLCGKENFDEDIGFVDITDRSDRDVDSICVAIDLTQRPLPSMDGNIDRTGSSSAPSDVTQVHNNEEDRLRIQHTLTRLKRIHDEILYRQQRSRRRRSPSPWATDRQLERLRSKVLRLQSINADLNSNTKSLQTSNERLSSTLENMKRMASDATVKEERALMRYETLKKQCKLMDESYRRHVERSNLDKNVLQSKIIELQARFTKLSDRLDLHDTREMEEISAKYRKMSQEVHDFKSKNARLLEESERKEREWEVRYRKETERCEGLVRQVKMLSERVIGGSGDNSDGGHVGRRAGVEAGVGVDGGHRVGNLCHANNRGLAATAALAPRSRHHIGKLSGRSVKDSNPFLLRKGTVLDHEMFNRTAQRRSVTKDDNSIDAVVGRARTAVVSLDEGKAQKGKISPSSPAQIEFPFLSRDKVTTRKFPIHLKGPLQPPNHRLSPQCRLSHDGVPPDEDARRDDSGDDSDLSIIGETRENVKRCSTEKIQVMMKTGLPRASNKRKQDDDDAVQSERKSDSRKKMRPSTGPIRSASSSSSRKMTVASYSPRQKNGNITSYFKPPLAERSYPAYKPHICFGYDLSTSLT